MAVLRENKLRAVLAMLERYAKDPFRKRSLAAKRLHRKRREELKRQRQLSLEEQQLQIEKRIAELEELVQKKGKIVRLPCNQCGRIVEFDLDSVLYLAKMFNANPDDFLLCPACRSQKGAKRRLKSKIRQSSGMQVM